MDYYPALGVLPGAAARHCDYLRRDGNICTSLVQAGQPTCGQHVGRIRYQRCRNAANCGRAVSTKHGRAYCNVCEKIAARQGVVEPELALAIDDWRRRFQLAAYAAAAVADYSQKHLVL